eukprot:gene6703-biopygen13805
MYPGKSEKRPYIWSPLSQDGNRVEQQDELVWVVTCRTKYVTGLKHLITTKWGNLRAGPKLKSESWGGPRPPPRPPQATA